jgi:hypothetical protein
VKQGLYGHIILETPEEALVAAKRIQAQNPSKLLGEIITDIEAELKPTVAKAAKDFAKDFPDP